MKRPKWVVVATERKPDNSSTIRVFGWFADEWSATAWIGSMGDKLIGEVGALPMTRQLDDV